MLDIREKLKCCLATHVNQVVLNKSYLIKDEKLEVNTKLLFFYDYVLSDLSCDEKIDEKIINQINNICGCSICTDCQTDEKYIVEEWVEDLSNYDTAWRTICFDCEKDQIKWRVSEICCEKIVAWRPIFDCCEKDKTAWRPVEECCEQITAWRVIDECCEQRKTMKKSNKCKSCKRVKCKCTNK